MSRLNLLEALTDNIRVDPEKCVFCGECVDVCVLDNLRMKQAPCRAACPLGVNCQGYVQAIHRGDDRKAYELLTGTLPFPEILARVCPAPCEDACHRNKTTGLAVAVKALKRYLVEQAAGRKRALPEVTAARTGRVAIVGSGPAGMMAAFDLACKGRQVAIFDSEKEPGGMLRWAIPEFKLPANVVEAQFELLQRLGVKIECGVEIGVDRTLDEIKSQFDAVIVATGCAGFSALGIEGEDLDGVLHGLPFLKQARDNRRMALSGDVVVIGGGNVAVDAAQTAIRLGADSAVVVSLESVDEMPAFPEALESAMNEGVTFEHRWGPVRIAGKNGRVTGVELQRCLAVFDSSGKFDPYYDGCMVRTLKADRVIVAIGQKRDIACLTGCCLEHTDVSNVDPVTMATADPKVFLAGDFASGPTTVIDAMASGRRAAESVDRFLRGEPIGYGRSYPGPVETNFEIDVSTGSDFDRMEMPVREFEGKGDFSETTSACSTEQARQEASRCYSCGGPFGKYRTCWFCLPCEVECPEKALYVEIPYLLR